jgi:hypothetical protein
MSAEEALARIERRVLAMGGLGSWLDTVGRLRQLVALDGNAETIRGLVLALSSPTIEAQALAAVLDAFAAGADDAARIVREAEAGDIARRGRPSAEALAPVRGLDRLGREALAKAQKLALGGADRDTYLAPLLGHEQSVRMRVSDAINRGGNEGATRIADAAKLPTVWVAETNACVVCLAYSGQVAEPGAEFAGGLSYGRRSYPDPVGVPPRHPRCRCTVEPLVAPEYAEALRREADRSVLRGFSLPSESMAVRIDAADRLVARGVDAPKSVIAFARKSIKAGAFPTRGRPNA